MRNIGVALAGGHGTRRADDFYPTPPEAVEALFAARLLGSYRRSVWEPACGDGAISKVLERHGLSVIATDLVDRGYGEGGVDFLKLESPRATEIVTNPPFNLAEDFIRHAFAIGVVDMALLLKAQFWHAARRLPLFRDHPPAVIAPLTWRLDFTGGGAPTMDCAWVLWGYSWSPETTRYRPLPKPAPRALTLEEMLA